MKNLLLEDHLGNVRATLSDYKTLASQAIVNSATDYYPFGMVARTYASSQQYRFGYGTQEKDIELGEGIYTAEYWEYDSRLGRRWNVDPVTYEWQSPYACFNNNPIYFNDPEGLEGKPDNSKKGWYKNNHGDYFYQHEKKPLPIGPDLVWEYIKPNAVPGDGNGEMKNNTYATAEDFNTKSNYAKSQAEKLAATRAMMARYNAAKKNATNTQGGNLGFRTFNPTGNGGSSNANTTQNKTKPYFSGLGYDLLTTTGSTLLGAGELSSLNTKISEINRGAANLRIKNAATISQYTNCAKYLGLAAKVLGAGDLINSSMKILNDPSKATLSDYAWLAGDALMFGVSLMPQARAAGLAAKYAPQLARYVMPMAYQGIQFGLGTTYSITKTWIQNYDK